MGDGKHTLMLSFQHARYFVTLKLVATDKDANVLETKCFSFRVYSSTPTAKPQSLKHNKRKTSADTIQPKRTRLSESQRNGDLCVTDNFFDDFDASGELFDFDTVESSSSPLGRSGARNLLPYELDEPGPTGTRTNAAAEYFGVPRLPRPLCTELHAHDLDRAIQHLLVPVSDNSSTLGIGVTGMKGIGKTTFYPLFVDRTKFLQNSNIYILDLGRRS